MNDTWGFICPQLGDWKIFFWGCELAQPFFLPRVSLKEKAEKQIDQRSRKYSTTRNETTHRLKDTFDPRITLCWADFKKDQITRRLENNPLRFPSKMLLLSSFSRRSRPHESAHVAIFSLWSIVNLKSIHVCQRPVGTVTVVWEHVWEHDRSPRLGCF